MVIILSVLLFIVLLCTPKILAGIFTKSEIDGKMVLLWAFCLTLFISIKWLI